MEVITKSSGNLKVITGGYAYNDKSVYTSGDLRLRWREVQTVGLQSAYNESVEVRVLWQVG